MCGIAGAYQGNSQKTVNQMVKCVEMLNGMFAFIVIDCNQLPRVTCGSARMRI